MSTRIHEFILSCVSRKVRERGYEIVAYEGDYKKISNISFKIPMKIIRHRPDIIGLNKNQSKICIGEAKTYGDIFSKRTKEQFSDYSEVIKDPNIEAELIIGIPKDSEQDLIDLLSKITLREHPNVTYLLVPKELMPNE
jgi:hypothetical protein